MEVLTDGPIQNVKQMGDVKASLEERPGQWVGGQLQAAVPVAQAPGPSGQQRAVMKQVLGSKCNSSV